MPRTFAVAFLLLAVARAPGALPSGTPADVGMESPARGIAAAVDEGLKAGNAPGAVVVVVRKGKVVHRGVYGSRALKPAKEAMTGDTVFDLASLTKPMATATSVMVLLEKGKLRLADPASKHLPEFKGHGKEKVTVEQLLQHTSGLIADNPLADYKAGRKKAWEKICELRLVAPPGERFVYSDVGFIVLGELVERLSGEALDAIARKNGFAPLGMDDTTFKPGKALAARAAPTQREGERWLRGEVHDPRARLLGGVAGHAGLFSTADDVAVFAQMLLGGGTYGGKRVLSAATVRLMTTPRRVPRGLRALGWDVRTSYSGNRGELFGGFGHTGFTGTSLWVDPDAQTAVV